MEQKMSEEEKIAKGGGLREDAPVPKKRKKRRTSRRLTDAEWGECGAFWESGQFTLSMLSERYNVTPEAISRKMTKMGYVKGKHAEFNEQEVKDSISSAFSIARDEIARRLLETRNRTYKYVSVVESMAAREIQEANKAREPIGNRRDNFRALNEAMTIFEKAQRQKLISLGIKEGEFDIGEELPTLSISKMTPQEIKNIATRAESVDFESIDDDDIAGIANDGDAQQ